MIVLSLHFHLEWLELENALQLSSSTKRMHNKLPGVLRSYYTLTLYPIAYVSFRRQDNMLAWVGSMIKLVMG